MQDFLKHFPNYVLCFIRPNPEYNPNDEKSKPTFIKHNISFEEAEEYNQLRWKGDIYFSPNGDFKKNVFKEDFDVPLNRRKNIGRSANAAENIYAFVADIDYSKEEIRKNYEGLDKPSYVIETFKGHHLYYILEKPLSYVDFKKEFTSIEEKLVVLLKSDPKCTDSSRILRVPGYKYRKDNIGEYEITIKENNGTIFKYDEFSNIVNKYYQSAGRDTEEMKVITKKIKDKQISKSFEDFFESVQRLDVTDVLNDLFGSIYDVKSGGAIYEGGKRTDGYKYCKRGNYLNTFSDNDRPTGGPYSVAKFYYKNTSDTIEYFTRQWNIEFNRFKDMKPILGDSLVELKRVDPTAKRENVRYGGAASGIIIDFKEERIIQYYDKGESEYVNGIVESYGFYKNNDTTRYIIKTTKGGVSEIKTLPMIGGGSDLRKFLMSMGLIVGESKQGLIYLLKYLTSVKKQYLYTDKLGLQYIDGNKVIVTKGGVYIDEEQNLFVNIPETSGEFCTIDSDNTSTIEEFVKQLIKGYNGTVSFVSLLVAIMGVNSWFFRENKLKLPQYFLMGLSQTGKTTFLENLFEKGLGMQMEIAASSKPFVYQKMAKHYMPIHFCEYRNTNTNKEEIEGQIRILFDGTEGTKGKSDQSVVYYPSNAMYMMDGQATFTDDASLTRLFLFIANPRDKGELKELEGLPNILNKLIDIFKDNDDFIEYIKICRKIRGQIKEKNKLSRENDRMLDNFAYIYGLSKWLGLEKYNKYIDEAMARQDGYLAVDDIKMTYQKIFNLQQIHKFGMYIYKKGLVIEVVEEYLRSNNTDDLKGFIKTVNQHFLSDENSFIGMETYVSLDYIYANRPLRNSFMRSLRYLSISGEYSREEHESIGSLKVFLEENFSGNPILEDLNYELRSNNIKSVEKEKEF